MKLPSTLALYSSHYLNTDRVGRGVGFEIEGGGGLERTVGLEGKEGIVTVPWPAYEVVGQSRIGIWISGIELAHYGADGWFSAMVRGWW